MADGRPIIIDNPNQQEFTFEHNLLGWKIAKDIARRVNYEFSAEELFGQLYFCQLRFQTVAGLKHASCRLAASLWIYITSRRALNKKRKDFNERLRKRWREKTKVTPAEIIGEVDSYNVAFRKLTTQKKRNIILALLDGDAVEKVMARENLTRERIRQVTVEYLNLCRE